VPGLRRSRQEFRFDVQTFEAMSLLVCVPPCGQIIDFFLTFTLAMHITVVAIVVGNVGDSSRAHSNCMLAYFPSNKEARSEPVLVKKKAQTSLQI